MASFSEFNKSTTSEEVAEAFADHIAGKTVLITGVSPNGLGEAMAVALASKQPAKLIFTARDTRKAEAVAEAIKQAGSASEIQVVQMDLSSFASVQAAGATLADQERPIDVLINNAGVMGLPTRTVSADGHEMHFATNFLGHWLFTNLLILRLSPRARIVNVTSGGYMVCPIRFHDIDWQGHEPLPAEEEPDMAMVQSLGVGTLAHAGEYNGMLAYLHSNAASMLLSVGLTERLKDQEITAISAAPGVVVTELQRHINGFRNPTMEYKTATQGAASFLVAALDPALQGQGGGYVDDCQLCEIVTAHVQDKEVAKRLWRLAESMTGLNF